MAVCIALFKVQLIGAWHQNGSLGWIDLFSNVKDRFIGMVAERAVDFGEIGTENDLVNFLSVHSTN